MDDEHLYRLPVEVKKLRFLGKTLEGKGRKK